MRKKIRIHIKTGLVLFICIAINGYINGQYPIFSPNQFSNLILINPAFAGSRICPQTGFNYLLQNNPDIGYHTFSLEFDTHIDKLNGGIGLTVLGDRPGSTNNTLSAGGIYSYRLSVNRTLDVRTAVKLNYMQSRINFASFTDRYDFRNNNEIAVSQSSVENLLSVGGGLVLYSQKYFAGFSVENINSPKEAVLWGGKMKLPLLFSVIAGFDIKRKNSSLFPIVTCQWQDKRLYVDSLERFLLNETGHFSINLNYNRSKINAGAGYRYIFGHFPSYHAQIGYKLNFYQLNYNIGISPYKNGVGDSEAVIFH